MMTPIESAVRGSLEGTRGDRCLVRREAGSQRTDHGHTTIRDPTHHRREVQEGLHHLKWPLTVQRRSDMDHMPIPAAQSPLRVCTVHQRFVSRLGSNQRP